jgi:hypothetical protein
MKVVFENLFLFTFESFLDFFLVYYLFFFIHRCKDCRVFEHTVRSKRCPIKCWGRVMLSMPLNTKKQKDNQEPQNTPPDYQNPRTFHQIDREKSTDRCEKWGRWKPNFRH